jgi:ribosomal protein S18 acetylase RimI-like enzyme
MVGSVTRIRPATDADAAAVTALWTEAYSGRAPLGRDAPYEEAEFFAAAARGRPFVAERSGDLVGIVVLCPPGAPGRAVAAVGEAELSRLAVSAAARRRGIGRALAEHCAGQARDCGAAAVALWSRPYQVEAHRLYASLGYRRRPERDSRDREGERLVFALDLF